MIKLSEISNLVLSGGGLLGLSYIGLFRYLEEHNAIHQIKTITGCSAGAIFGTGFIGAIGSLIGAAVAKKNPVDPFKQDTAQ